MSFPGDAKSHPALLSQTSPLQPLYPKSAIQAYTDVEGHPQAVLGRVRERRSLWRRVLRGLLFIFVTLWVVNAAHRLFLGRNLFSRHRERNFDIMDPDYYYDIPADLVLEDCIQGANWTEGSDDGPYSSASATFEIPLSAENIFLLSRGHLSAGLVNVITSSEQAKGSVTINIVMKYRGLEDALNIAKACLTSRPQNQQGVGIFTPTWRRAPHRRGRDIMYFDTTVTLPEDSSAISIKGFETDVPNTMQTVGDLESKITFESISLRGTNTPINIETLSAVQGHISTTNSGIRGTFNATKSLILETTNSPISVAVGLHDDGKHPTLVAHTTNAHFDARLSLTTPSSEGGQFSVDTTTTNSPLTVSFIDAPLESSLEHHAKSSNSRVEVTLHPTYEGDFDASTSRYFRADLNFQPVADPSGKGRKRGTSIQSPSRNHFFGETHWVDATNHGHKDTSSNVVISTSNSPVTLNLLGN